MECPLNSMECQKVLSSALWSVTINLWSARGSLWSVSKISMECKMTLWSVTKTINAVRSHSQSYELVLVWVKFVLVKGHNSLVECTYMGLTHTDRNMLVLTLVRALRILQILVRRDTKRK